MGSAAAVVVLIAAGVAQAATAGSDGPPEHRMNAAERYFSTTTTNARAHTAQTSTTTITTTALAFPPPTDPPAPWYPTGFELWPGDLAVSFLSSAESTPCDPETRCWHVAVITRFGCPGGIYVELSLEDASGTVVGMANDTVGGVRAGQQAILRPETFSENVTNGRLTTVTCI